MGLFGQQNLGNECTLEAIIYHARRYLPDAEIRCICTGPEGIAARHKILAFPLSSDYRSKGRSRTCLRRQAPIARLVRKVLIGIPSELVDWVRAFKVLKGNDLLLVPGTGFLTDAYTGSFGWPYEVFKWSLIAKVCGCKLFYVSVGAGPLYRPLSRWFIKCALSFADFRSYRDDSSREYLGGIGFRRSDDRVYPDLAFNLPGAGIPRGRNHGRGRRVVGVGLMAYAGELSIGKRSNAVYVGYLEKLLMFVRWLLAHEYDVRLLIGDVGYDEPARQDFRYLLRQDALKYEGRIIDEPIPSVEHLLSQLAATDIVVGTRFHNVLLALVLNKPVISISFHHKCLSLMEEMGLAEYCQDIHHLDIERLIKQFVGLEMKANRVRATIKERTKAAGRALDEQYAVIFGNESRERQQ